MAVVTPIIYHGKTKLDPTCAVVSIDIRKEVGRIPQAELRLLDGDAAKRQFALSDAAFFEPGAKIEVRLRREGGPEHSVFTGLVVRHGVEYGRDGHSGLVIGLKDEAVRLTGTRSSNVFSGLSDSAIMAKLIREAQLTPGQIEKTPVMDRDMVQYQSTPWDFICSRAEALGLLVVVDAGKVSVQKMALAGRARHKFELGISNLFDVELEADAGHQVGAVESVGWDVKQQQLTAAQKAQSVKLSPGNLDGGALGKAVGNDKWLLTHAVPLPVEELKSWANATLARSRMALLRGRFGIPGRADVNLLDTLEVAGIGKRWNGKTLLTGICHRIDAAGWRTDLQFGLSPERFARKDDLQEVPAAGLLPAVSGLQIGVVAAPAKGEGKDHLVKVILPGVNAKKTVWARLATPDAGNDRGYYFRPEPKDEVIVGFLNDDPRCPVILGSLFSAKNRPPAAMGAPNEKNERRGLVSRRGTTIGFIDGKKATVYISTAGGSKLLLDDEKGAVSLTDSHGNSIAMSKDGIEIKTSKKLTLKSAKEVVIDGPKVNVK